MLGPDLQKVVGTLGCGVIKRQLAHVFPMPPFGSAASSSHGIGPPGLLNQNAHQIAIDVVRHQQLQGSESQVLELQSVIEQLQVHVARLQQK